MPRSKRSRREPTEIEIKKQMRKLTIQNKKLTREVDNLKQEIEMLQGKGGRLWGTGKYRSSFRQRADNEAMFSKKSYPSFVWSHLMHTSFFNTYKRILSYIRKYAFITMTIKILTFVFVFIEAVIFFIISTSAFIISVLITFLLSHILMLLGMFTRKKQNKKNRILLTDKDIVIFFPPKGRAFDEASYFKFLVGEYASKRNCTVLVVSPFLINSKGLFSEKKPYHSVRHDAKNVLLVRRSYYFNLRKRVIDDTARSITEIY